MAARRPLGASMIDHRIAPIPQIVEMAFDEIPVDDRIMRPPAPAAMTRGDDQPRMCWDTAKRPGAGSGNPCVLRFLIDASYLDLGAERRLQRRKAAEISDGDEQG